MSKLIDRDKQLNDVPCLLCGHNLSLHLVMPYTTNLKHITDLRVECKSASKDDYNEECKCNAGFKDVEVNVVVTWHND